MKLVVERLSKKITQEYVKSLDSKPSIVALAVTKDDHDNIHLIPYVISGAHALSFQSLFRKGITSR